MGYKYKGPIPMKEKTKKESLLIKTYHQVKNILESLLKNQLINNRKRKLKLKNSKIADSRVI
jgi:hypothetical protein